jgi:hypothetical protein
MHFFSSLIFIFLLFHFGNGMIPPKKKSTIINEKQKYVDTQVFQKIKEYKHLFKWKNKNKNVATQFFQKNTGHQHLEQAFTHTFLFTHTINLQNFEAHPSIFGIVKKASMRWCLCLSFHNFHTNGAKVLNLQCFLLLGIDLNVFFAIEFYKNFAI